MNALRPRSPTVEPHERQPSARPVEPIETVIVTDEVGRRLFEEYAGHVQSPRGPEEIGWILLGYREGPRAVVVATLPAGAERDASAEHIRFNSEAQALASRIVRQHDRRLMPVGIVHTHPGTLRHPSRGDLRGDREWVRQLRGRQGVFAIGTKAETQAAVVAESPKPHVQTWNGLRFDWYTLSEGEDRYQPVPVELTIGPDLAAGLRPVWPIIEAHAVRLERLIRQQKTVDLELSPDGRLLVRVPLAETNQALRLILEEKRVQFVLERDGEWMQADLPAGTEPDRGVYLLLAELTK